MSLGRLLDFNSSCVTYILLFAALRAFPWVPPALIVGSTRVVHVDGECTYRGFARRYGTNGIAGGVQLRRRIASCPTVGC